MSEAVERATKREIRRAIGPAAVKTIEEHDQALAHHAEQIRAVHHKVAALKADYDAHLAAQPRTFWQRLCWFLTGHV